MTEWKECKLKELADFNPDSLTAKSKLQFINYLDTGNITKGKIDTIQYLNLSTDKVPSRAKRIVKKNDIVYSTVRPNQEHYGIIKNPVDNMMVSTGFVVLRSKEDKCYSDFLYYFLTLPENTEYLSNVAEDSTTAYPSITPDVIMDMDISLPPLPEQKAIAEVLSSLDDKIDLLTRQNKTLEDLAQAYFRKWFIEDASDEWEVGKAKDYFEIGIGKTPPRKEEHWFSKNNNDVVWVSISDMGKAGMFIGDSSEYLTKNAVKQFNIKRVPKGAIILSFKLTVGRVAIALRDFTTNEAIAHFIYRNLYEREYLYFYLKTFDYYSLGSTSSIATAVNSKIIKDMPFVMPDVETLKKYHKIAAPMFSKIESNTNQILTLQKLRDTLLPKLISGEIRVKM
jgi:type I restriction enzyme S subunit